MLPQPQYRDTERAYQRVVAGIGWPGAKPGAVCVVGEEAAYRAPNLYLLDEIEESDPGEFFRVCTDLEGKYSIGKFCSRLDEANLAYLSMWNRQRRESRLSTLSVSGAPFSDDGSLQYQLSIVKDKLRVEQKSLFLGEARVAGLLTEIQTGELADIKDVDNPLIAALAYAVAALVTWKYVEPMPEPDSGDYDILRFGLK